MLEIIDLMIFRTREICWNYLHLTRDISTLTEICSLRDLTSQYVYLFENKLVLPTVLCSEPYFTKKTIVRKGTWFSEQTIQTVSVQDSKKLPRGRISSEIPQLSSSQPGCVLCILQSRPTHSISRHSWEAESRSGTPQLSSSQPESVYFCPGQLTTSLDNP